MGPDGMTAQDRDHEQVDLLLPWFQNGTLSAEERRRVEAHLGTCGRCRAELALVRATADAVREAGAAEPAPAPWAFARVAARIEEAEAARLRNRLAAWGDALWRQPVPGPVFRRTVAGAALLVLAQAAVIGGLALRRGPEPYRLLAGPAACQAPAVCLQVVFQEGASERAMREALRRVRARIVDGPTALGRYTVALEDGAAGPGAAEGALAALRAEAGVVKLAERAP